ADLRVIHRKGNDDHVRVERRYFVAHQLNALIRAVSEHSAIEHLELTTGELLLERRAQSPWIGLILFRIHSERPGIAEADDSKCRRLPAPRPFLLTHPLAPDPALPRD